MATNEIGKRFSFPSVRVSETINGPLPLAVDWRNVIGVAAPFNRGPSAARITSRKQFIALYGEDSSPGSVFVQQAMLQGANEFVISRVTPVPTAASGAISFTDDINPLTGEATVGLTDERTVGLTLDFELISTPSAGATNYYGLQTTANGGNEALAVGVNTDGTLAFDLDGLGYFDVRGVEQINIANLIAAGYLGTEEVEIEPPTVVGSAGLQYIVADSGATNISKLVEAARPGLVLKAGAGTDMVIAGTGELTILSYPRLRSDGKYEILVSGEVTSVATTTDTVVVKAVGEATTGSFTVLSNTFRPFAGSSLPADSITLSDILSTSLGIAPISYTIVDNTDVGVAKPINYLTYDGTNYGLAATGVEVTFGESTTATSISVSLEAVFTITVLKQSLAIGETDAGAVGFPNTALAFDPGESSLSVLNKIRAAILDSAALNNLFSDITISSTTIPYTLGFSVGTTGPIGNDIRYTLDKVVGGGSPTDLNFIVDASDAFGVEQKFVGGSNDLNPASLYLYDRSGRALIFIQAISPGSYGNDIQVSVRPEDDGQFSLDVVLPNTSPNATGLASESYSLSNFSVDLTTGLYPETANSNLIRAFFIPALAGATVDEGTLSRTPVRTAPIDNSLAGSSDLTVATHPLHQGSPYMAALTLSGGVDLDPDADISESDLIAAIDRLEGEDIAILSCPSAVVGDFRYTNAVNTVVAQAEASSPYNGLRIAVLPTTPRLTPSRAELLNKTYTSARVVLVSGYARLNGYSNPRDNYNACGYYAGTLATRSPHISPAATVGVGGVNGVAGLDTTNNLDVLDQLTKSNIEVLHIDPISGATKFLNGRTTAGDYDNRWVSLRRYGDHLIMNLFRNLQWARSQSNDNTLRTRVASACDAFLQSELSQGHITSFEPTIADESINTDQDIATGNLNVKVSYVPVFPADYINMNIVRNFSANIVLNLNN